MQKSQAVTITQKQINGKKYLVPEYNLYGCQKYMLPKLDNAAVQHVYFNPHDIDELYKQQNFDVDECNLKIVKPTKQRVEEKQSEEQDSLPTEVAKTQSKSNSNQIIKQKVEMKTTSRPKLRQTGFTHFIHIPLEHLIGDDFDSLIKPQIQEGDLDVLVDRKTLHATIFVFRLKSLEDIPKWQKIVKSVNLKKAKVYMKGADIFPVKKTFTNVVYLNINGLDDIIDTIVSKAISQNLVSEKELSHISFDKQSQTYKMDKQHVTIMRTKGNDLIDGAPYIKAFSKLNFGKININKIALSMIGSGDGQKGYFDEFVHEIQ